VSENRYAPPEAEVASPPPAEPAVPDAILRKIRNAWVAGLISSGVTLVFVLIAISGTSIAGFTAWEFADVALMLGLSFGLYRKSRTCAVLMLAYFVISKALLFQATGRASGMLLALVFLYYYAQGVVGTFAYHRHLARQGENLNSTIK
jgi:hypothetical protein